MGSSQLRERKRGGEEGLFNGGMPAFVDKAEGLPLLGRLVALYRALLRKFAALLGSMGPAFGAVNHGAPGWMSYRNPKCVP